MTRFNVLCVYIALIFSYFDSWIIELFSSFCFMNFLRDRCHPPTRGASWTSFPIKKNWDYFQESPFLVTGVYVTTSVGVVGGESTLSITTSSCITHIKSAVLFSHTKSAPASQSHRMWSDNLLHWPGGAFLACVLLYKIDMEVSHMRWGPGYYIHGGPCMHVDQDTACTVVHACMFDHAR